MGGVIQLLVSVLKMRDSFVICAAVNQHAAKSVEYRTWLEECPPNTSNDTPSLANANAGPAHPFHVTPFVSVSLHEHERRS